MLANGMFCTTSFSWSFGRFCLGLGVFSVLFAVEGVHARPAFPQAPDPQEVERLAREAQRAFQAGDFVTAARDYDRLVNLLPDVPGLHMNLGLAYYLGGNPAAAVEPLRRAVSQDPSLGPAWLFLGAALLDTGRPQEAVSPLREYLKLDSSRVEALEMLGDALLRSQRWAEALPVYRQALSGNPESARSWYGLGKTYELAASRLFDRLDEEASESAYWLALIGEARLARGQFSSAFFFLKQALKLDPRLRGVHAGLAAVYRLKDRPDWAETEEQREAALGPPDCQEEPALCRWAEGDCDGLLQEASKSEDPSVLFWAIRCANRSAANAFRKLEELPPSVELHRFRAELERSRGRHSESVAHWKEALKLSPDDPTLQEELAFSLYLNRHYEEALTEADRLLQQRPGSPTLQFLAGDCRLNLQRAEEAIPFLERSVELDPSLLNAHAALGRAYMLLDRPEKALPHLEKALPTDGDGSLHFQVAQAYRRLGRMEDSQRALQTYQEIKRKLSEVDRRLEEEAAITPP